MNQRLIAIAVCHILSWEAAATAVETVRVDASAGAPRLVVDGRPVRARMFWGAPQSRPLALAKRGQLVEFEFAAREDELQTATMHLRFGHAPGDIYLDNIHVRDLDTERDVIPQCDFASGLEGFRKQWTFWPQGAQNIVGTMTVEPRGGQDDSATLHVRLAAPPDGRWPDFHIYHHPRLALQKGHRYRVSLWARADPARDLTIGFYRPGEVFVYLGGPPGPFAAQIRLAAAAGVDFVSFPVGLPWPRPGQEPDWSSVDAACQEVLDCNPRALLLPRIGMGAPPWWREAHPDDAMVWDRGAPEHHDVEVSSSDYRRDAAERLAALVGHLESRFGGRIAGYHPCGQHTGEWFYQGTWGPALNGYSAGARRDWRRWLRDRYATDERLRAAWRDPQTSLDAAEVPSPAARRAAPAGMLRDPVAERPLLDFADFQQQMMADCVCHLAHAVRQASGGRKLVVFFYGYVFEFSAIRNGPATAGHYALRRVLQCPDIDVLCSPISYFDRQLGGSAPAMTAAESISLAGKLWLYEDDTATCLSAGTFPGHRERVDTIEATNALLVRNTAQCAVRNFGSWWMDLGATGWFNDRRMWDEMVRLRALDEPLLNQPRPFRPEVAAVIDERSMTRVAFGGHAVTVPGVYEARAPLGRMGAPYGQYLQDDVLAGRVPAKMYVMLSAWCLSPEQRRQLRDATRGGVRVWCYAPGYQEPERVAADGMTELTGFRLQAVTPPKALAKPTGVGKRLGLTAPFGMAQPVKPLFAAVDATAEETLAVYPDGSAAVALRRTPDGSSLFVGPPGFTSQLLRLAARQAGVHLFTQTDCNVYANGPYLILHASQDGPLEVDTGKTAPIAELFTGRVLGTGPKLTLPLKLGDTRVLVYDR
jgi:hypothetical protein